MREIYKVGDEGETGQTIKTILGQSQNVAVFTTTDNQLRYEEYRPDNEHLEERQTAITRFDQIMADISTFVAKKSKKRAYHQLGKALYSALDCVQPDMYDSFFKPLEEFIKGQALFSARFAYIITSFATTCIFGIILWIIPFVSNNATVKQYLFGGICGLIGALVSVLQRSSNLELDYTQPQHHVILQGVSRSILGLIFGSFIVLASQGNLLLGMISDNVFSLYTFCFVAGVSERFVPEIIEKMEISQLEDE